MSGEASWSERLKAARPAGWVRSLRVPRRWRAALIVAAVVAAVALAVCALLPSPRTRLVVPAAVEEARGDIIRESGDLRSASVTPVHLEASGEVAWLVEEGSIVEPGDVIVRISSNSLESKLEQSERSHIPRKTEVGRAEQELASARALGPLRVRRAQVRMAQAEWKLADLGRHPTKEDLASARIDRRVAELAREKHAAEFERVTALAKRGFATEAEVRERRLKALDAQAQEALAKLKLELVSAGTSSLTLEKARLDVAKARLDVEKTEFDTAADITIADKALDVARARLANGERDLERLRTDVANMEIKAPVPGRVTFSDMWRWTKDMSRVEVGETVRWGMKVCEIADPSRLQARIHVNEIDAVKLATGLAATARLTAFPGIVVPGRVAHVGRTIIDKNESLGELALRKAGKAEVGVVEVLIDLDFGHARSGEGPVAFDPTTLRGGHTVTVEIDIAPCADTPSPDVSPGEDAGEVIGGDASEPEGEVGDA